MAVGDGSPATDRTNPGVMRHQSREREHATVPVAASPPAVSAISPVINAVTTDVTVADNPPRHGRGEGPSRTGGTGPRRGGNTARTPRPGRRATARRPVETAEDVLGPLRPGGRGEADQDLLARLEVPPHPGGVEAPAASAVPSSRRCWPPGTRRSPARRTSSLDDLAARYRDRLLAVPLNVTDPAQAEAAVAAAVDAFGRIDVVVNNAGYADIAPVEEVSLDSFRAQIDAVFLGTVHVTKAALPVFRRQGNGYFIQVTSVGGRGTAPGLSAYQSGKFAVEGFSGVLQKEVGPLGIRVTLAEPGAMRTDWAGSSMEVPAYDSAYEPTVGALAAHLRETTGKEPIDPAKAARFFLDLAEDHTWADVGRSVDFDWAVRAVRAVRAVPHRRPRSSHLAAPWPRMVRGRRHRRR
ncbi:SDR family NAD(P)-dependent oxidoreductase [Streptomyces sp. NPDC059814]|uniref:SDR family NAD(P)-dependent oxidoreductase n=1 Tax=Streptomyces sp. NPDC059814 TaxID=3346959 RepID=UPI00365A425F